jgi:SAM-dependent methyltransferase
MSNIISAYNIYYAARTQPHVYPVEFVVRTFLGRYPKLRLDPSTYPGRRILDLGYGDGRNFPLLFNLGFEIAGVEISDEINRQAADRIKTLGISADLRTGHNSSIPFPDKHFAFLLACHSCYYVSEGDTFTDNLHEIARVLEPNGVFVCSLAHQDTYILRDAEPLGGGHYRITHDPYGLRDGTIFRAFASTTEIEEAFGSHFIDLRIGYCDDNFYGIEQRVWIVTCWKK